MQKMSHVAKNFFLHTAGLFYQEEQNAAEKEFFQHNKQKNGGGVRLRHVYQKNRKISFFVFLL